MGKTHDKRIKIHDTRSKPIATGDKENIVHESSVSLLNMEQEQEQNVDTANNKSVDWSEDVDLELSVGEDPTDTGSSSFDETENSSGNMAELSGKTAENPDVMDSIMQEEDPNQNLGTNLINSENKPSEVRQWSSLFTKLKSGKATYSSFAPRDKIHTKNDNALIFNIQSLENISINDIVAALYAKIGDDLIAAKPHYKRGKRLYLEVIFTSPEKQQMYAARGIVIFKQTLLGYIPVNLRCSFLPVRLRNVPMGHKDRISNLIKEATEDFGKISSIKPMVYEGTPVCTNQWIVIFETTEDPDLIKRIPRYTHIWDQKVTLEWKEAPKIQVKIKPK